MKFILLVSTLLISILLAGCAGSPASMTFKTNIEVYQSEFANYSLSQLCGEITVHNADNRRYNQFKDWWSRVDSIIDFSFSKYGTTRAYCDDPAAYHYSNIWDSQEYKIDGLLIVVETKRKPPQACHSGNIHRITLQGMIGPDSSFAIEKLVNDATPCSDIEGNVVKHVEVQLESNGGLINDGYLLGRTLKKYSATTIVKNDKVCASSCAVAFLGGEKRIVEDNGTVLFHAPYYNRLNGLGKSDPNCAVEGSVLNDMQSYFTEMTNTDISKRLFERTMWYCSADNGWTVTGGNAAKLYGIATE